jgi:hypothetical protein
MTKLGGEMRDLTAGPFPVVKIDEQDGDVITPTLSDDNADEKILGFKGPGPRIKPEDLESE